jgi:parallel beta-helix repeat protein
MQTLRWLMMSALALSATSCWKDNPLYCQGETHMAEPFCKMDAPTNPVCMTNDDCPATMKVCVVAENTCVECTGMDLSGCADPTKKFCGADRKCTGCAMHSQCESKACLPTGRCANESEVAYVEEGKMGTTCTMGSPCDTLAEALATNRSIVKFVGGTIEEADQTNLTNKTLTIIAEPGAHLTHMLVKPILNIVGGEVTIKDLTVGGAGGTPGIKVDGSNTTLTHITIIGNAGLGIDVLNAATLTINRSIISSNGGGGIRITDSSFVIVGNTFFDNGKSGTTVGGIAISTSNTTGSRFEFNSFGKNDALNGIGQAVQCVASFNARNNIMYYKTADADQFGGGCSHTNYIAYPQGAAAEVDPQYQNAALGDLHIGTNSPACGSGAADPVTVIDELSKFDIDGNERKGTLCIGAYQLP